MDPLIRKILKANSTDGVYHTHVSLMNPKGKFQFNRETTEEFFNAYCEYIQNSEDPMVGIAEKAQQYLPVIVDVDLRIKDDGGVMNENGLYTEKQLEKVVEVYQSVIKQIVDKCESTDLICVVLEKDMYQQTKNDIVYFKHGFHLHFPYLFLNNTDQEIHLIPRVQEILKELHLFANLNIEDSSTVIDKACCKVPWLLYGSRKSADSHPYLVTKVYDENLNDISLEKAFKHYTLYDYKEKPISLKGKVKYYLPRILSIMPFGRTTKELKHGLISPLKERIRKERKSSANHQRKMGVDESIEIAKKLLPLIGDWRADDRNEWMTVGWTLFNISEGHPDGLDLWCEFSSRCEEKYDESYCIHQWGLMTKKDLTLGTLRHMAMKDNPEEYKKFKKERSEKYIAQSLDGSHTGLAKALFEDYGDEFVCASITGKSWYQFVGNHWEYIEDGVYLRKKISKFIDRFKEYAKSLYDQISENSDKGQQAMIQERIKQVNKMIKNLNSHPFKKNVMKEAEDEFYDETFKDKLDADPYLMAFKNGVYDLRLNIFRQGRPEDYISKTAPIRYIEFTEEDEKVQDVHTFLEQVFPDKSVRKYFMDVASDVFVGGNHEKTVLFWTGEGDNGKSVTQSIFEQMLGKLSIKLNTTVITAKKPSAGSAFADLARAGGGVRWAVLEEPDGDEALNIGVLKILTGNDTVFARDLFEKGKDTKEIKPMFKLVFICNKLPRIRHADKAVWNRVRVIPFESTFCRPEDPAPESYEEQLKQKRFPMDKQFAKKIPGMLEAFAWVLLQHRKTVTTRIEPEKVRVATELYKKQNDLYKQFIDECIIEDKNSEMSLMELYNIFKSWFRESMPGNGVPVKNEVEEYFNKAWGPSLPGKKWKGFKQFKEAIRDGDAVVLSEEDLVKEHPMY